MDAVLILCVAFNITFSAFFAFREWYKQQQKRIEVQLDPEIAHHFRRKTLGSAGFDLCSITDYTLEPGEIQVISTGVRISLPKNCVGLLKLRSSKDLSALTLKGGIIDSDYTGPVGMILQNTGTEEIRIEQYQPIAQMLILKHLENAEIVPVDELVATERGDGGFGSTDVLLEQLSEKDN